MPIFLALSRIYSKILNNESLYKRYIIFDNNLTNTLNKVTILIYFIEECTFIIKKLSGFVYDPELFLFKNKIYYLLNAVYDFSKNIIQGDERLGKLVDLINALPQIFYSKAYLELSKNKDLCDVFNSKSMDKISSFENKFLEVNNYFEQYEVFKKFVNSNIDKSGINGNINIINDGSADFYYYYALLLLKFCKYHNYIFINKEENEEERKNLSMLNDEDNEENARVIFLLDRFKLMNDSQGKNIDKNVIAVLNDKQFHSVNDSNDYRELIKKEINFFLEHSKHLENHPKLKPLREQMEYFIGTLGIESYVPLYLKAFSRVTISDNFTPSFSINVPARNSSKLYLETKYNEQFLVFIEFFVEDKTKDITFHVNKYDYNTNSFIQIFHEEKIQDILGLQVKILIIEYHYLNM